MAKLQHKTVGICFFTTTAPCWNHGCMEGSDFLQDFPLPQICRKCLFRRMLANKWKTFGTEIPYQDHKINSNGFYMLKFNFFLALKKLFKSNGNFTNYFKLQKCKFFFLKHHAVWTTHWKTSSIFSCLENCRHFEKEWPSYFSSLLPTSRRVPYTYLHTYIV